MLYQILLVWILAVAQISTLTTLSRSNCPSKFLINKANVTNITKQQFKSYASQFYSLYDNQNLKSSVQQIVVKGNTAELSTFITSRMMPYIILIVIVTVSLGIMCICCIFQKSCPPDSLRRDLKKNPYTKTQFRVIMGFTLFFSLATVLVGLVAFSYIPSLKRNVQFTTCSIYVTLDGVLNGQDDTGWGGFYNLYYKIGNVSKYLSESLDDMDTYLKGDEWLIDTMESMKKVNMNIYKNNKDAKLVTPNPITTKNAVDNGFDIPMIESQFITKGLGPNGTFNTMVDDIDRSLRTTQILSNLAYEIQISAKRIVDSSDTLLDNTKSSQKTLDMYIYQLQASKISIDSFKKSMLQSMFHSGLQAFQAILGLHVIGAIICMMGVFAVYCFQVFSCKSLVTFGWSIFGIGLMGSVISVYVTFGLGSLGYGFCNYFDSMISSKTQFNKLGASDSQNPFNRLDSCFYGDGNVLNRFDLGQEIGTVTGLFQNIENYYALQDPLSTSYVDKSISPGRISSWMNIIQNYRRGIFVDYNQSVLTQNNPNYAITRLNLFTKKGTSPTVCANDRWVFDATNCTDPDQQTYAAGTSANGVALQTVKDAICISFNQKFSVLQTKSWDQSDFTRRYTQTRFDCQASYDKILEYGYALLRFRDSRQNLFKGIYDDLDEIRTMNIIFNNNISDFKDKVYSFQNSVSDLSNVVTNSLNGLLVSSDCRAIVDSLKFTYNTFCINTMYDIVRIGYCSIFISVFSLLAMIFGYIFTLWFGDVEKNNKMFDDDYDPQKQEISSSQMLKDENEKDLGKDLEKLGQFTAMIGTSKTVQSIKKDENKNKKKVNYNSDSSEEQNPYAMELNE